MLNSWVAAWNSRIADWIAQGPACDMGLTHVLDAYRGEGPTVLERNGLPEPYVGDPLGGTPAAVLLMLNPGGSGPVQWHPDCALVKRVKSSSYHSVASEYLAPETRRWWEGRSRWPARLLGQSGSPCSVVGIDLVPWHSRRWGRLDAPAGASEVLAWFREGVFEPAAAIAGPSKLSVLSTIGLPVVLAVGVQHAHVLPALGFSLRAEVDERTGLPEWPVRGDGQPVKRSIRLFVSGRPPLAVLQSDAPGGFKPPSEAFDPVVRRMLGL